MGIGGFLKKIGGFFAKAFSRLVNVFIEDFEDVAGQIVGLLMLADMPGSRKFKIALSVLAGYAAKEGKRFISHAARLLIELEVTKERDDDLERIIDEGLEAARLAVESVNELDMVGDNDRRKAAVAKLRADLIAAGKEWLTEKNILHVLIELAVASIKK